MMKLEVGEIVFRGLDPLKRKLKIIETFKWLKQTKIIAQNSSGEFIKDYDYEFKRIDKC